MGDQNDKIMEIACLPGNDQCADCKSPQVEYASYNLGVFLCTMCVGVHRSMGTHISQTRHLRVGRWTDENQIAFMEQNGNIASNAHYEKHLPDCYRRPDDCTPPVLLEQFIRAKYEREEFVIPARQSGYVTSSKTGHLFKRGKDSDKFEIRRFELSEANNTLAYVVKERKNPKLIMSLQALNVALVPDKIKHPNGMQITYVSDGTIRHIYVYHNDGQTTIDWYQAIRNAKLNYLRVAFPGHSVSELLGELTHDFRLEGWLFKIGPRAGDQYRRRWFTLDDRKLMYHDQPLDPVPKGVISIGEPPEWSLKDGVPPGSKDMDFSFTLKTPVRTYLLSAQAERERQDWMVALEEVLLKPLTPQHRARRGGEGGMLEPAWYTGRTASGTVDCATAVSGWCWPSGSVAVVRMLTYSLNVVSRKDSYISQAEFIRKVPTGVNLPERARRDLSRQGRVGIVMELTVSGTR